MRKRWKEVGLGLLTLLIVALAIAGCQPIVQKYMSKSLGPLVVAGLALIVYIASVRWIERRPVSEFDSRHSLRELAAGLATGFGLFSAVMALLWAMGIYHPAGFGPIGAILGGLSLAILSGVVEELLFRGILFRASARLVGTWGALLFTSLLFGLAHLANKGATLSSGIAIMLEAGILLGAAYAMTERLWLPIGLHIGWNFTEGSIFGMSVSGNSSALALLHGSLSGPQILAGGAFGPEASVVAVMICLLVAGFFLYRTVKMHRAEPPAWHRQHILRAQASGSVA